MRKGITEGIEARRKILTWAFAMRESGIVPKAAVAFRKFNVSPPCKEELTFFYETIKRPPTIDDAQKLYELGAAKWRHYNSKRAKANPEAVVGREAVERYIAECPIEELLAILSICRREVHSRKQKHQTTTKS